MSTTNEQRLRDALERTLGNFRLMLSQKPVRDAAETIAEAERALAQQAPTPAMFEREMLRDGFNRADGTLSHTKDSAHTWGSPSEPAAPAVAREERGVFADRIASAWEACIDAQMYLDRAFDALDDIKREAGISSHAARRVGRGKGEGGSSS